MVSQAYIMSTVDYFTLLGWMFMGLILIVWLAKPPFTAKPGLRPRPDTKHRTPPVGASLLAIAVDQSTMMLNLSPQSRAGSLLQGFVFGSQFAGAASCGGGVKSKGASANPCSSTCSAHP